MRLILTRHAKSDWSDDPLKDHDRSLNPRGRRAADAIGGWMAARGHIPDRALLSTARRVTETWSRIARRLPGAVETRSSHDLYHAPPEAVLAELAVETAGCIVVVSHNPGLAALAQWLVRETPQRPDFHRYPTGATLVLDLDVRNWADVAARSADVVDFIVPRDLPA